MGYGVGVKKNENAPTLVKNINDKLQGSVRCGGVVNDQIDIGLLR